MPTEYETLTIDRTSNSGFIVPRESDGLRVRWRKGLAPGQVWEVEPIRKRGETRVFRPIELLHELPDYEPKYGRSREDEREKMQTRSQTTSNNADQKLGDIRTPRKATLSDTKSDLLRGLR